MSTCFEATEVKIIDIYYKKDEKEVNELLKQGWRILAITQSGNTHDGISTYYHLGR